MEELNQFVKEGIGNNNFVVVVDLKMKKVERDFQYQNQNSMKRLEQEEELL